MTENRPNWVNAVLFGLIGFGPLLLAAGVLLAGILVLYAVWFVLTFGITWLLARILGGMSMAVVDGVAQAAEVRRGSLEMACVMLVFVQVIIVPWSLGAGWLLRRVGIHSIEK